LILIFSSAFGVSRRTHFRFSWAKNIDTFFELTNSG
jgi:hypothetical protein